MLHGICPKCDSKTIYHSKHKLRETMIRIGFFLRSYVDNLVCSNCGFIEQYILDADSLRSIEGSWVQVRHHQSLPLEAKARYAGVQKGTDLSPLPLLLFLFLLFAITLFLTII